LRTLYRATWLTGVFACLAPLTAAWGQAPRAPLPPETDLSHDGWYAEMPPALAEAKRTGKDMLIDFGGSDWCVACSLLKEHVLTKPAFIERASKQFVLVDIDTLARGLSPARKARYVALQKKYKVGTFPSVFLATPEGEPYAWTTYIPPRDDLSPAEIEALKEADTPEHFWAQLEPLIAAGKAFREGLAKADGVKGAGKADLLIDAMAHVRPDFIEVYYSQRVNELKQLDAADHRGFLAYLAGAKAYNELELKIGGGYDLNPAVKVADVDALIARYRLKGETLQQALAMKTALLVREGKLQEALGAMEKFVAAQSTRSAFDRGDYLPVTSETIAKLKQRIAEGKSGGTMARGLALHRIFEYQELPSRYKISCHATETSAFEPDVAVRRSLADIYGTALLESTASLQGEKRAKALGKGLEGTSFLNNGAIRKILLETLPSLVGSAKTPNYLPEPYRSWVG
jgi:thiol-disulfide isomerase/thioredoxin